MRKAYVEESNLKLQGRVKLCQENKTREDKRDCSVQTEVHCIPTKGIIF